MALTETVVCKERRVLDDGRIELIEETSIFKDGVFHSARKDPRVIDVGDDVSSEDILIQNIVNGNLHTAARVTARQAVRDAEET